MAVGGSRKNTRLGSRRPGRRERTCSGSFRLLLNLILRTDPGKLGTQGPKVRRHCAWDFKPCSNLVTVTFYDPVAVTELR